MKGTLTLANPIKIDGKEVKALTYDTNEITAEMFVEADIRKMGAGNSKRITVSSAAEIDYGLHLYLGFMAITAVNPDIDVSDLERIHGRDVVAVMRLGRGFFSEKSEAPSSPDNSDESSEAMPETSTPQSEISSESD